MDNGADDFYRSRATPTLTAQSNLPLAGAMVVACMAMVLAFAVVYESQQAPTSILSDPSILTNPAIVATPTATGTTLTVTGSTVTIAPSSGLK